jgi:hypothetical protein
MYWAINVTKATEGEVSETDDEWFQETTDSIMKGFKDKIPFQLTTLAHFERKDCAYGPFETQIHAEHMTPSGLNEANRDFENTQWWILKLPMVFREFQEPIWTVQTVFLCSTFPECDGTQRFKGSCSKCKAQGKSLIPTIQIRDWDKKYD